MPQNMVDHRIYDHSCIPKYLETVFGLNALTNRDRNATDITTLVRLSAPRDTSKTLPAPANSAQPVPNFSAPAPDVSTITVSRPAATVNEGNLPAMVHSAMQQDLTASPGNRACDCRPGEIDSDWRRCRAIHGGRAEDSPIYSCGGCERIAAVGTEDILIADELGQHELISSV